MDLQNRMIFRKSSKWAFVCWSASICVCVRWLCRLVGSKGIKLLRWIDPRKWGLSSSPAHYTTTLNSNSQIYHFQPQTGAFFASTRTALIQFPPFNIWAMHFSSCIQKLDHCNRLNNTLQQLLSEMIPCSFLGSGKGSLRPQIQMIVRTSSKREGVILDPKNYMAFC